MMIDDDEGRRLQEEGGTNLRSILSCVPFPSYYELYVEEVQETITQGLEGVPEREEPEGNAGIQDYHTLSPYTMHMGAGCRYLHT